MSDHNLPLILDGDKVVGIGSAPAQETLSRLRSTAADMIDFDGRTMKEWDHIRAKCEKHKGSDLPRLMFEALIESFSELMTEAADVLDRMLAANTQTLSGFEVRCPHCESWFEPEDFEELKPEPHSPAAHASRLAQLEAFVRQVATCEQSDNQNIRRAKELCGPMTAGPAMTREESDETTREVLEALEKWYGFQSAQNTTALYNVASKLFSSDFDPREYDDVE